MIALLIANSLALASLLIMLSSGLALIYGLRDVINFGHGAIYMLGAYLGYTIALVGGFWLALLLAFAVIAAWMVRNVDADESSDDDEPQWRNGLDGYGLYRGEVRIDGGSADDE